MATVADKNRPSLFDPVPRRGPAPARPLTPGREGSAAARAALLAPERPAPSRPAPVATDHEPTLEDLLTSTWGGLRLTGTAACPMCGGELAARYGAGANPVGGRCRSCATELG